MVLLMELEEWFEKEDFRNKLVEIYGYRPEDSKKLNFQIARYQKLAQDFHAVFPNVYENIGLFTAAGRTEIGGNHTDHQLGHILAASVDLDIIGIASKNDSNFLRVKSEGYTMDEICLDDLSIQQQETNHAASLIRGLAKKFSDLGYSLSGFDLVTTSNVLKGSGLSSSAAFEVLIGNVMNTFFAEGQETSIDIAKYGQYAENVYYGKPSGLMDQMASSVGGMISVDFHDPKNPIVDKVAFDFSQAGYSLCIIDSGSSHNDLTDEYGFIFTEMQAVAEYFQQDHLSRVDVTDFYNAIPNLRAQVGDRAVLRAIHYFNDDQRVLQQVSCLQTDDFSGFLDLVKQSGFSSYMYLQNVFAPSKPTEQGVSLVLALCQKFLESKAAAWRVHGGGFAGTIQAFVPDQDVQEFKTRIEAIIGRDMCYILKIRPVGGICIKN